VTFSSGDVGNDHSKKRKGEAKADRPRVPHSEDEHKQLDLNVVCEAVFALARCNEGFWLV
jgi:hypothetical protein